MSDNGSENGDVEESLGIGVYEGDRNAAKERHGTGKNLFVNGDVYEGAYIQSKRHGEGVYKWKAGHRYVGAYDNNQRHGQGYFVYPDGSKYKGEFQHGKRHGQGTYVYVNGDVYQGAWEDNLKNGKGTYIYQNGGKVALLICLIILVLLFKIIITVQNHHFKDFTTINLETWYVGPRKARRTR
ncbi:hypothetical protein O5D80_007141 [Batrachochytrium dendrobatidis]|nr:hypothetical protein O5D80_007141 [Batrachochytrium dendrobatidis]